jgi:chorismate mutase/prephenate dehydratase
MTDLDMKRRLAGGSSTSGAPRPIEEIRQEIDALDAQLVELLAERRHRSLEAARTKEVNTDWLRDEAREAAAIAQRIQTGRDHGLDSHYVSRIFREVMSDSLRIQQDLVQRSANAPDKLLRVAFQGIEGAYSHLAARQHFARAVEPVTYLGCDRFHDVVEAVEKGRADAAVLPIENTTSGGINEVYDLLLHAEVSIVGEIKLRVDHCLLGIAPARLEDVRTILCHPQTVMQCSDFLAGLPNCTLEYFTDTALSGKRVKEVGDISKAAIASEEAANILGLSVIARGIANQRENYTRFLVAARKPIVVDPRIPCKTSIVMMTGNESGALLETLIVFRDRGINLTKLESRPILENPWEEMFYLDFLGNLAEGRTAETIDEVTKRARFIKVLGSYPLDDAAPVEVPELRPLAAADASKPSAKPSSAQPASVLAPAPKTESSAASGYRLASRSYKPEDTVIEVKGVKLGGRDIVVIAGPCAVESAEQILACAREVKERGAHVLRGGCFKPRTSPYSFQGLGYEGLEMLAEAGRRYDLPIVTEVLAPEEVGRVAEQADILQVGARNMQNFALLSEVGRSRRPVMLKRGMSSSLDELLQAAEYILAGGNQQVFLCERGIRTFETSTRNTLDLSAVPVLRGRTHLPVIVDPSHAAGKRDFVAPLAIAGKSVGAHAIMVEIHPEPEKALSDGPQALHFPEFAELMERLLET